MSLVTLEDAATRLPELICEVENGAEIILTRNDIPIARLASLLSEPQDVRPGMMKGRLLYMAPDFDETPEGFEEYVS